jgi:branched-chain amino acid transport system ATP-binding protein
MIIGSQIRHDKDRIRGDLQKMYALFPVLEKRKNQLAGTLSGGEQQMLAIVRSLMSKPILLLLDEPSLGLSPILVREIYRIIKELQSLGTTILLVEQNIRMALNISNRGYILESGRIVLEGFSSDLLNNPKVEQSYLGR